jgi:hypothetical protein
VGFLMPTLAAGTAAQPGGGAGSERHKTAGGEERHCGSK